MRWLTKKTRVIDGVADNLVGDSVDVVGLGNEATEVVVLVEIPQEREVGACDKVAVLGPDKEVDLLVKALVVAIALVVATPGADVDGNPSNADVGVVVVLAVDAVSYTHLTLPTKRIV